MGDEHCVCGEGVDIVCMGSGGVGGNLKKIMINERETVHAFF